MATLWVKPARDDGQVALWERHPDHPGEEVFLAAGDPAREVADTPLVRAKLRSGDLIIWPAPAAAPAPEAPAPAPAPVEEIAPVAAPASVEAVVAAAPAKPKRSARVKEATDGAADSGGV